MFKVGTYGREAGIRKSNKSVKMASRTVVASHWAYR